MIILIQKKDINIEEIISDKKYECDKAELKILELLKSKGAIDLDKYICKIDKKYMNIIAYYLDKDSILIQEVYDRLPDCHKSIKIENLTDYIFYYLKYGYRGVVRDIGSGFVDAEKEVKKHVCYGKNKT